MRVYVKKRSFSSIHLVHFFLNLIFLCTPFAFAHLGIRGIRQVGLIGTKAKFASVSANICHLLTCDRYKNIR